MNIFEEQTAIMQENERIIGESTFRLHQRTYFGTYPWKCGSRLALVKVKDGDKVVLKSPWYR